MVASSSIQSAIKSKLSTVEPSVLSSYNLDTAPINSLSSSLDYINNTVVSASGTSASTSTTAKTKNGNAIAPTSITTNGGIKETNPPKPSSNTYISQKGQPQTPPTAQGKVKGTQIDKTNKKLEYVCDFTIGMEMKVCGEIFGKVAKNELFRMESLTAWTGQVVIPLMDEIKSAYDTIKGWYDMIKQWLDQIKELIQCMQKNINKITT